MDSKRITSAVLASVLIIVAGCSRASEEYAVVSFFIGDVKKNERVVEIGEVIKQNDRIVTGNQSSCDVRIGNSIIRIKEKSSVIMAQIINKEGVENTTLGLDVGKMLCKPKKLMKSESFLVKTPTAVAGVRGTKFTVETDRKKTTRIKVYDGKVQVVKRVTALEREIEKMLTAATPIEEKEKVVITEKDVQQVSRKIEKMVAGKEGKNLELVVVKVMEKMKNEVVVTKKDILPFKFEDFREEKTEIIAVKEKPKEVIKQIAEIMELEKDKPKPDGRLLVTRYEIYFIKNGKVLWEGKVINPPVKTEGKIYIASGDYVYCASVEGPVLWRRNIENDGRLTIKDNRLMVYTKGVTKSLDLDTGQE